MCTENIKNVSLKRCYSGEQKRIKISFERAIVEDNKKAIVVK